MGQQTLAGNSFGVSVNTWHAQACILCVPQYVVLCAVNQTCSTIINRCAAEPEVAAVVETFCCCTTSADVWRNITTIRSTLT